jgi:hypothetical protein
VSDISAQEWRDQLRPQAVIVQRLMNSPGGGEFLALLEQVFQPGELMQATDSERCYAIGQYELVSWLKQYTNIEVDRNV